MEFAEKFDDQTRQHPMFGRISSPANVAFASPVCFVSVNHGSNVSVNSVFTRRKYRTISVCFSVAMIRHTLRWVNSHHVQKAFVFTYTPVVPPTRTAYYPLCYGLIMPCAEWVVVYNWRDQSCKVACDLAAAPRATKRHFPAALTCVIHGSSCLQLHAIRYIWPA